MTQVASGAKTAWKRPSGPMLPQLWMRGSYLRAAVAEHWHGAEDETSDGKRRAEPKQVTGGGCNP